MSFLSQTLIFILTKRDIVFIRFKGFFDFKVAHVRVLFCLTILEIKCTCFLHPDAGDNVNVSFINFSLCRQVFPRGLLKLNRDITDSRR